MSQPPDSSPEPDGDSKQPDALHRANMYPAYATIPAAPLPKPYGWWADIAPRLDESQRNVVPMVIKAYDHLVERQQMEMDALHAEETAMLFARVIANMDLKFNEIPKEERRERTKRTALVFWRAWGAQVDPIYKRERTWAEYDDFVHDAAFEAIKYLRLSVDDFNDEYEQVLEDKWGIDNHERYEERRRRRDEEHTKQRQEYLQGIGPLQIIPGTQGQGTPLTPHGRSASIPSYTPPSPTQVHRKISNDLDAGSSSEESFSVSGAPRPVKFYFGKHNEHLTTLQRDLQTGLRHEDFKTCRRLQVQEAEKLRQQQKLDLAHLPQESDSKFDYAHQRMSEWHQKQKLKIRRQHLQELQVLAKAKNLDQQPKPTSTDPQTPKPSYPSHSNSLKRARSLQGRSATPFFKRSRSHGPRYLRSDDDEAEISFLHRGPLEDDRMIRSSASPRNTGPRRHWYERHSAPAAFTPYTPEPRIGRERIGPLNAGTLPDSQPLVPALVITKPADSAPAESGRGRGRPRRNNPSNLTTPTSAGAFPKPGQPGGGSNSGGLRPGVPIGKARSGRDPRSPGTPTPNPRIPPNDRNPELSPSPGSFFDSAYYASVRTPDRKAAFGSLLRPSSSAAVISGKQQPDGVSAKSPSFPKNNAERGNGHIPVSFNNTDPFAAPKPSVNGQRASFSNPPGRFPATTSKNRLSFLSDKPKTSDKHLSLSSRPPARPSTLNSNHRPGATSTFPSSAYVTPTNRRTPKSFLRTKPLDNDDAPLFGSDSHQDGLYASPDSPFSPGPSRGTASHNKNRLLESDSDRNELSARPGTTRFSARPSLRTTSRNEAMEHDVDDLSHSRTPKEVETPRNMLVASRNTLSDNLNAYDGHDGFRNFRPFPAAPKRSNMPQSRLMASTRIPFQTETPSAGFNAYGGRNGIRNYGPSSAAPEKSGVPRNRLPATPRTPSQNELPSAGLNAHSGRKGIRDLGPSSAAPGRSNVPPPTHTPRRSRSRTIPGPDLSSPHTFPQYERNAGIPTEQNPPRVEVSRPGSLKRPHPDPSPSKWDAWKGSLSGWWPFSPRSGNSKSGASAAQIPTRSGPGLSDDRTDLERPDKRRRLNAPVVDDEPLATNTNTDEIVPDHETPALPQADSHNTAPHHEMHGVGDDQDEVQRKKREFRNQFQACRNKENCAFWESQVSKADSLDAIEAVWRKYAKTHWKSDPKKTVPVEPTNGTQGFGGNESAATPATDPRIEINREIFFRCIQRCRRDNTFPAEQCDYWESQADKADSMDALEQVWLGLKVGIPPHGYQTPSKQKSKEKPRRFLRAASTRERMRRIVEETQMADKKSASWLRKLNNAGTAEGLREWKSDFYEAHPNYNPKVTSTTPSGKRDREGRPLRPSVPYPTPQSSSKTASRRTPPGFVTRDSSTPQTFAKENRHLDPRTAIESRRRGSGTLRFSDRFPRRETPKGTDTSQFDSFILGALEEANKDGTPDASSGKKPSHVPKDTGKQQRPPAKQQPRRRALNASRPKKTGGTGSSDSGSDTDGPEFVDPDKRNAPASEDDGWETPSEGSNSSIFGGSGEDDDDGARDCDWEPDMRREMEVDVEEGNDQEKEGHEEEVNIEEETVIDEDLVIIEDTDTEEEGYRDEQEKETDDEEEQDVFADIEEEDYAGDDGEKERAGGGAEDHISISSSRDSSPLSKSSEEDNDETLSRLDVGSRYLGSDDEYNDLFEEDDDDDDDEANASESTDYGSSSSSSSSNSRADRRKRGKHSSTSSSSTSLSSSTHAKEADRLPDALPSYLKLSLQRYIAYWALHDGITPPQAAEYARRLAKCSSGGYADVEEDVVEQLLERQLDALRDADPARHAWLARLVADDWVPGVGGKHDWTRFVEPPCDTRKGGCGVCAEKVKDGVTVSSFYGGPG